MTELADAAGLEEVYSKFISGGQMQPLLGIWKRFFIRLLVVDRLRVGFLLHLQLGL